MVTSFESSATASCWIETTVFERVFTKDCVEASPIENVMLRGTVRVTDWPMATLTPLSSGGVRSRIVVLDGGERFLRESSTGLGGVEPSILARRSAAPAGNVAA